MSQPTTTRQATKHQEAAAEARQMANTYQTALDRETDPTERKHLRRGKARWTARAARWDTEAAAITRSPNREPPTGRETLGQESAATRQQPERRTADQTPEGKPSSARRSSRRQINREQPESPLPPPTQWPTPKRGKYPPPRTGHAENAYLFAASRRR